MQSLQAFEIADRKIVTRCRYAQYRREKTTIKLRRWIIMLAVEKPRLAL
jgi:hypothetical protein